MDHSKELERLAERQADVSTEHVKARLRAKLFGDAADRVKVGRFTVLERLGEGGMGVVFAAYDHELDRKVAVKLIRSEASADTTVRIRLLREAKALARLSDPHVVQVYEVGEHAEQVYIAMELVEGITLADWLAQDPPRSWRDCVRLFRQVGRGLAAAHAAGVVHRDFKPANVLIGKDGRPRVVDFGLAFVDSSRLETTANDAVAQSLPPDADTRVTASHAIAGTPAYMAPEQFAMRPTDARTDQFAFCIALWEAVYRLPPFDRRSFEVLAAQVTEGAVQMPASPPRLPAWLRAALHRGLQVDPDRRWPSMDALLHALARGLDRGRRIRRRVVAVGTIALVGTALALAIPRDEACAAPTDRLTGVWDASTRAGIEKAMLDTGLAYAADTWRLVDDSMTAYVDAWMDVHVEACEAARSGEQSAETLDRRMVCLDMRFAQVEADVRVLETIDARGVVNAAAMVAGLPELSDCADVELLMVQERFRPPHEHAAAVGAMHQRLAEAQALDGVGKVKAALTVAREVLAEAEALGFLPMIARARVTLGLMLEADGDFEGARKTFERARLEALEIGDQELVFRALDRLVFNAGLVHDDLDSALSLADVALATLRGIDRGGTREEAYLHDHVGAILRRKGDYEASLARHTQALELLQAQVPAGDRHLAIVHVNIGVILYDLRRYDESLAQYEAGLAVLERGLGAGHPDVGLTHGNIALTLHARERFEEALVHHRAALDVLLAALSEDHPDVAVTRAQLGRTLESLGRHEEALEEQLLALASMERSLGKDHPDLALVHGGLSITLRELGRLDEALAHARSELDLRVREQGGDHPEVAYAETHLARILLMRGEHAEAEAHYRNGLRIAEATEESPDLIAGLRRGLGNALLAQDRAAEAVPILEPAVKMHPDDPDTAFALARALATTDRTRAVQLARAAAEDAAEAPELAAAIEAWLRAHD